MGRRSKISGLPRELVDRIERELVADNFSGYDAKVAVLNAMLERMGRPERISRSSMHRHGSALERRLSAVKASTEAARQIAALAPDDADERSAAVMSLVQTDLFNTLLMLQEANEADDHGERIKMMVAAARSITEISRASVNQKKWARENEARIRAEERERALKTIEGLRGRAGVDAATLKRVKQECYGLE
jgi:hypothetical protein